MLDSRWVSHISWVSLCFLYWYLKSTRWKQSWKLAVLIRQQFVFLKLLPLKFVHKSRRNRTCSKTVQSYSHNQLFATPWTAAGLASLSIINSHSLLKLMSIESVMPSNHLILCCPLLLLPSVFPSIRVFSNESVLHIRWPKYWSFSFSISPSNEYSGLISFRIEWFYLLAIQETLKSLLQYHSSKASILPCSAFSIVHLSHSYMTTRKP